MISARQRNNYISFTADGEVCAWRVRKSMQNRLGLTSRRRVKDAVTAYTGGYRFFHRIHKSLPGDSGSAPPKIVNKL